MDVPNENEFMRFYEKLEHKSDSTVRFFDHGDFFTVHGTDAEYIAEEILKTISTIRFLGHSKLPSLSIAANKFNSLLKEIILVRCYRVEIYEKTEKWHLKTKASPGDLGDLEEIVYSDFEPSVSRGLISVKVNGSDEVNIGLSFVDVVDSTINIIEFQDNQYLTNFEALLVQLGPRECILPDDSKTLTCYQRLKTSIFLNNVLLTEVKSRDFKCNDVDDEISNVKNLLRDDSTNTTEFLRNYKQALSALSASIKFLKLTPFKQYDLQRLDIHSFVRLDSSAISSLNLFSKSKSNRYHKSVDSIYSLLNFCKTSAGQRLLAQWIRQPLTDVNKINERLNLVECFIKNVPQQQALHETFLRKIPDFIRLSKKFHCEKASLHDCYRVMIAIDTVSTIVNKLSSLSDELVNEVFVNSINVIVENLSILQKYIQERIVFNNSLRCPVINPEHNRSLCSENKKIEDIESRARVIIKRIAGDLGLELGKGLKDECNDSIGFFLRVTKREEKALRTATKNYILVDKSKKDGVRFLNKALEELNEEYLECRKKYNELQKEVINEITSTAAQYSNDIRNLGFTLSALDVIVSLSIAATKAGIQFTRPKLMSNSSHKIVLQQVRHPCVEVQEKDSYIPNDVNFEEKNFLLVTGPNMGGKSTYIRSVGICVLMAQIGSFVPAKSATISVVDGIYTRIGAKDKPVKGYSTFMMEMIETTSILRSATANSLVIIDELGRGTSTYEGFGLAWAISDYIAKNIKAFCLFATHFHELTELANETTSVGNLHVSALTADGTLTYLYEVRKGSCDESFGIKVAEIVNFPKHMLELSGNKVKQLEGPPLKSDFENRVVDEANKLNVDQMDDVELREFVNNLKTEIERIC